MLAQTQHTPESLSKGAVFFASQLLRTQLLIFVQRNYNMNIWHKRYMYQQILIMLTLASTFSFYPLKETYVLILGATFIFLQIAITGSKAYENPQAVFYKPSCVVALLDAISIFIFLWIAFFKALSVFGNLIFWINPICLSILFLYIAIRKIYIIKNYSYEK